jgi:hypothetical protein
LTVTLFQISYIKCRNIMIGTSLTVYFDDLCFKFSWVTHVKIVKFSALTATHLSLITGRMTDLSDWLRQHASPEPLALNGTKMYTGIVMPADELLSELCTVLFALIQDGSSKWHPRWPSNSPIWSEWFVFFTLTALLYEPACHAVSTAFNMVEIFLSSFMNFCIKLEQTWLHKIYTILVHCRSI